MNARWRGLRRSPGAPPETAAPASTGCADLDTETMERAYARWAPVYDAVCGPIFRHGRKAAAAEANIIGGRILEVGVGTGLSLGDYSRQAEVVGIDLSEPMLAKARRRMRSGHCPHVRGVLLMDAHRLAFADASFDCIVAQFVITLVAQPETVLSECARVVRPGGSILLVNHLYSEHGAAAVLERLLAQPARAFGLRPEFPFLRLAAWARAHGGVELVGRRDVPPFNLYTLVHFRRRRELCGPLRQRDSDDRR
jgi:phosphatidylethanolamine/phosphatidyl-N-methylethanolamine N-methyltransferase